MRILQIANAVSPGHGGYVATLRALAHGYRAAGHAVIRAVPGPEDRRSHDADAEVVSLRASRVPRTGHRVIVDQRRIVRLLNDLRPDRIEVAGRCAHQAVGRWAQRHRVPTVAICNERLDAMLSRYLHASRPARVLADFWNLRLAVSFDTIVCPSGWAAHELTRLGAPNVATIAPAVDLSTFHPGHASPQLRRTLAADDQPLIVMAGHLAHPARPELAIEAVRDLQRAGTPARLVMAGAGPLLGACRRRAAGLPVTFMDGLSEPTRRAQVLATADLVLAPGPAHEHGVVALEALACGTPVVGCRDGAVADLASSGSGGVVDADAASFAAAAMRVLSLDPQRWRAAARTRAERFGWPAAVAGMLAVHHVASERQPSREAG
jgi:alpha-1,6-mannosyltransferase